MNKSKRSSWTKAALIAGIALVVLVAAAPAMALTITGAGATFPYPVYAKWAHDYKAVSGVQINYQPVGSGGGIAAIEAGNVNFGATDAPLTRSDLDAQKLVQFPTVFGGVVPVVHISGIGAGKLKLTGTVLAQIYLGQITKWNDSRIKALNPSVTLPSTAITTVHRSDASGTTWIFTHYLNAVDSAWTWADKSGHWPGSKTVGGKGNEGVSAYVQKISGAIGYVEYAYAIQNHLAYTQLKNKSGAWCLPKLSGFQAAASHASLTWSNGFLVVVVNEPGKTSWPITGCTFILVKRSQSSYAVGHGMLKFFNWGYTSSKGISDAKNLIYVPMTSSAIKKIKAVWHANVKAGSKACW